MKLENEVVKREEEIKPRDIIFKQILVTVDELQEEAFTDKEFEFPTAVVFNQKECTAKWKKQNLEVVVSYEKSTLKYPFFQHGIIPLNLDIQKTDDFFNFLKKTKFILSVSSLICCGN
eukprot:snap_masked-scaffold_23-processed-gene-0.24-mRNA-1 protein AED:1.00 eAED:1.00 QI:0/-1/0/0/-1/1/1/0/117